MKPDTAKDTAWDFEARVLAIFSNKNEINIKHSFSY